MKKFRILEVKNARINSVGQKASFYYPQVTFLFGLFWRNIRPSEMEGNEFKGKAIRFRDQSNVPAFIKRHKAEKGIVIPADKVEKLYHTIEAKRVEK